MKAHADNKGDYTAELEQKNKELLEKIEGKSNIC